MGAPRGCRRMRFPQPPNQAEVDGDKNRVLSEDSGPGACYPNSFIGRLLIFPILCLSYQAHLTLLRKRNFHEMFIFYILRPERKDEFMYHDNLVLFDLPWRERGKRSRYRLENHLHTLLS